MRALHSRRYLLDAYGQHAGYCAECRQAWPCATEDAVMGVVGAPTLPLGEEPF